ncbi:MAG TPA: FAD-dependent monooxygenase, partial [Pseudonocardia sp.]|nr:FAD-dependent monooxygenase [Pseudonocardia sp.]
MTGHAGPAPGEVLIVGAGPTGLALAAQLHAHGGRVRIVDHRRGPQDSRAFVVHPRTLEVLAPLGVADTLVARGDASATARLHAGGRVAAVGLVHPGLDDTAYPFLLAVPQATVEEVLEEHLRQVGVVVERGVGCTGLRQRPGGVEVALRGPDGPQRAFADYVAGCDGAASTVRGEIGVPFPSRAYRASLVLADLEVDDRGGGGVEPGAFHGFVGGPGILFLFPSPGASTWRLLTVNPRRGSDAPPDLAVLQGVADRFTGGTLRLRDLTWSSTVRLRKGQATRYRVGRVLLAGDAAHVQSPAAAQGMNTGIQDAANLGWKLAMVTAGAAPESLLDSYHAERWVVARCVRHLTDLAFLAEAGDLPPLGLLRSLAAPLIPPLARGVTVPSWAFRLLGGLCTGYRHSPVVEEGSPRLGRGPR